MVLLTNRFYVHMYIHVPEQLVTVPLSVTSWNPGSHAQPMIVSHVPISVQDTSGWSLLVGELFSAHYPGRADSGAIVSGLVMRFEVSAGHT